MLLIIGGGIAAYKALDLIRRLKERGIAVRCILTNAAQHFATPLSVSALVGARVYTDLFDPVSEFDVGHIRLARETDLIVVAPATADLMAKMANGHADDLATAVLLATTAKIVLAPAMNPHMWANKATQRNLARLVADGAAVVGPNEGEMAEAESQGVGRMAEPLEITAAAEKFLTALQIAGRLQGRRILITSGPTHEPIDPVRYIANRSSENKDIASRSSRSRRRQCHVDQRPGEFARSAGRQSRSRSKARATCCTRSNARCPSTLRSSPPPSPTGASPMPAIIN